MITKDEVLSIHEKLIKLYGGLDGVRDNGALESAIARPDQTFGEKDLYPTSLK